MEPQHGRKGSDSHGSVAGAGGKTGLEGHDVELCEGVQLGIRGCKMDGNFQSLKKIK